MTPEQRQRYAETTWKQIRLTCTPAIQALVRSMETLRTVRGMYIRRLASSKANELIRIQQCVENAHRDLYALIPPLIDDEEKANPLKGTKLEQLFDTVKVGIGQDHTPLILEANQALAELKRRVEYLRERAEAIYGAYDSGTAADLDIALRVLDEGIEDCR